MGHKVNPISFRLPINKEWQSKWFARKDFSANLTSDIEIRNVLNKRFGKTSGVAKVEIIRDRETIKIVILSSKPGILIGRSGQGINDLKLNLIKNCPMLRDPKTSLPSRKIEIDIIEAKNPNMSAEVVAQTIANQVEKRIAYKRAIKQAIAKVMEAKAKGVKVVIAGRLGGAEIARREHFGEGSVPLGRLRADIDFAKLDALTTYGTCGIKVWIYKGDKLTLEEEGK